MDSGKPHVLFVLGGPGSGKGTQCKLLLKNFPETKFVHLSTGSLLRQATKDGAPEHEEIVKLMKEGKMVPSKPLVKLIRERIESLGAGNIYILDGFPRNKQNLEAWEEVIGKDFDVSILLYFECPEEQMRKRLLHRAKTSGRADDNPETIEKRIKTFYSQTQPMLEFYKESGMKLVFVNAVQEIEKVGQDTGEELKKAKII